MKRIHYLLIILAAMLVYAGKIWVIPLPPETITIDDKITIKKPIYYLNMLHKKKYALSDNNNYEMISLYSVVRHSSIFYSFRKEKDKNVFLIRARISAGKKDIKINTCYLQEELLKSKGQTLYQGYTMYAYPYIVGFNEINYDRMADFMRQIRKDENGTDRKIILLDTKIQNQPHPSKSQIPLK